MPSSTALTAAPALHGGRLEAARWVRDDRHGIALGLLVWLLMLLLVVPDGFDYSALLSVSPSSGSAGSRALWLALIGAATAVVLWRAALAWLLLHHFNPFLLAFAALAAVSVAWSIDPAFTARRLVRVAAVVLVAFAFVLASWHHQRFQNVLRPLITLLLAGSIVFALSLPGLGIHHEVEAGIAGSWRGLANHKNTLGMLAATGLILWLHAAISRGATLPRVALGLAVSVFCLIMSRSSTSLLTVLVALPLMIVLMRSPRALQPYMPFLVGTFALLLLIYALTILRLVPGLESLLTPIAAITGKDLTFTGRSDIWAIMFKQIDQHPWLGAGYGAYWVGPDPRSPSYEFMYRMYFYPGSAHNGYLEIANDLGFAGLLCLIGFLVGYLLQSLRVLAVDREQGALYLTLLLQQAVSNFSESLWLNVLSVGFVIMTLATAALARSLLELRLRHYFGVPEGEQFVEPAHGSRT